MPKVGKRLNQGRGRRVRFFCAPLCSTILHNVHQVLQLVSAVPDCQPVKVWAADVDGFLPGHVDLANLRLKYMYRVAQI